MWSWGGGARGRGSGSFCEQGRQELLQPASSWPKARWRVAPGSGGSEEAQSLPCTRAPRTRMLAMRPPRMPLGSWENRTRFPRASERREKGSFAPGLSGSHCPSALRSFLPPVVGCSFGVLWFGSAPGGSPYFICMIAAARLCCGPCQGRCGCLRWGPRKGAILRLLGVGLGPRHHFGPELPRREREGWGGPRQLSGCFCPVKW